MGVEYAFLPNWSAKIEYNYINFGTHSFNAPVSAPTLGGTPLAVLPGAMPVSITENEHIIKAGVNYRFGDYLPRFRSFYFGRNGIPSADFPTRAWGPERGVHYADASPHKA